MPVPRRVFQIGCILWMALIFWLSSQSNVPIPYTDLFPGQDKVGHTIIYTILGSLYYLGFCADPYRGKSLLLTVLVAILYGLGDEWHQSFVPNRDVSGLDLLADTVGGFLGALLAEFSLKKQIFRLPQA